jgi:GNAT superfamily N-acetyltransferase
MVTASFEETLTLGQERIKVRQEFVGADEYIEFLARTDLGKQYPREDFVERVNVLVRNVQISLVARNTENRIIGVCFGLTDFAYWLFLTDLGVDRGYERLGIGKRLMQVAHNLAGGESRIVQCCYANDQATQFYEKLGMRQSTDVMEKDRVKWTSFRVGESD